MFNSSLFNQRKFNSSRTLTEIVVYYFNAVINLVHTVKENFTLVYQQAKLNIVSNRAKINIHPRKFR